MRRLYPYLLLLLLGACDDSAGKDLQPADAMAPDGMLADVGVTDMEPPDAAIDMLTPDMLPPDMLLPLDPELLPPDPAPYRVGFAKRRIPAPVGIGASGFGPGSTSNKTPFASVYPGTRQIHTHPEMRAIVFESGPGNRLILIRTDTVGVPAPMRRDLVERLSARYDDQIDRQLILAGTHTHSGPGRLIDKELWQIIQDFFFPQFYLRMLDDLEATVVEAIDGLAPASVGHGMAMTTELHSDRRCASPDENEPEFPLIRVDRDGETIAVLLFHAVHGTIVGSDKLALSQDVLGGIEAKVAERFDHPVHVMFFNGAAADMGVGDPEHPLFPGAAAWPDSYNRIERVGEAAADAVMTAIDEIVVEAEGVIHSRTERVPIGIEELGYGPGEFNYQYGAVYCGTNAEERCDGDEPYDNLHRMCIPFPTPAAGAPFQAPVTVAQLGDRVFLTGPGEFAIALGRRAREAAETFTGHPAIFIGYAQEYMGYFLPEDDWLLGGYESSGGLWGPRQGDYFTDAIISVARAFGDPRFPLQFATQPPLPLPGPYDDIEPWPTVPSTAAPEVLTDVEGMLPASRQIRFTFAGGDPWLGAPTVTIEHSINDNFEPLTGLNEVPITSDGYVMNLELEPDPSYEDEEAASRIFKWTVVMPAIRPIGGGPLEVGEQYRFVARGSALVAGEVVEYELSSAAFTITAE